jgi:eukaryotic-like serine/threonine-protein kinase
VNGQTIDGRFLIEREVGAGGMGVVYRARDLTNGEPVAFKVLSHVSRESAGRFGREATLLAQLSHPSIVRYVAHGKLAEGSLYLVMEWLEGEGLDERLSSTGLNVAEGVAVVRQIAGALADAHRLGVVHRDLKPSNIFLRGGDLMRATVIDFGIARRVDDSQKLTQTGQVVGSPGYLAPEQAHGGGAVDARADVFALGCLLYECLTGRPAFSGEHMVALFVRLMLAEPDPLVVQCPEAPPELEAILDRLLAKNPDDRPRDAGEVLAELTELTNLPEGPRRVRSYDPVATIVTGAPNEMQGGVEAGTYLVLALGSEEINAAMQSTMTDEHLVAVVEADLQAEAAKFGARIDRFIDGSILALLAGEKAPERAARFAGVLRARMPDAPIVIASGGQSTLSALDANLRVLERDLLAGLFLSPGNAAASAARPATAIRLDEQTAGALGTGFDVRRDASGPYLIS